MMISKSDLPKEMPELKKGHVVKITVKKVHPDHIELDTTTLEHHLDKPSSNEQDGPQTESPAKVRKSKDGSFGSMDIDNMREALQNTENENEPESY